MRMLQVDRFLRSSVKPCVEVDIIPLLVPYWFVKTTGDQSFVELIKIGREGGVGISIPPDRVFARCVAEAFTKREHPDT
jgi:hypothetical protein